MDVGRTGLAGLSVGFGAIGKPHQLGRAGATQLLIEQREVDRILARIETNDDVPGIGIRLEDRRVVGGVDGDRVAGDVRGFRGGTIEENIWRTAADQHITAVAADQHRFVGLS